jgi:hypothetical protein
LFFFISTSFGISFSLSESDFSDSDFSFLPFLSFSLSESDFSDSDLDDSDFCFFAFFYFSSSESLLVISHAYLFFSFLGSYFYFLTTFSDEEDLSDLASDLLLLLSLSLSLLAFYPFFLYSCFFSFFSAFSSLFLFKNTP